MMRIHMNLAVALAIFNPYYTARCKPVLLTDPHYEPLYSFAAGRTIVQDGSGARGDRRATRCGTHEVDGGRRMCDSSRVARVVHRVYSESGYGERNRTSMRPAHTSPVPRHHAPTRALLPPTSGLDLSNLPLASAHPSSSSPRITAPRDIRCTCR
ncbi:hypothetical protein C8Q76DRAFT_242325 [Earliella scabrosa]|nr:hypothetical protein C8Q76DRAFT_242325 [Earliella scabrosa]